MISGRIIAYPKDGNIYTEKLYEEVTRRGVAVIEGVWSLRWLRANSSRGDVIHIHWPSFLYFDPRSRLRTGLRLAKMYAALRAAAARGATVVWTAHNLYPHDDADAAALHRIGRRIIVASADHVCVHGASAAAIVRREFDVPESRLHVGHHPHWIGCYPNNLGRIESRSALGLGADEFVYLFFGRCRPYKGLEALIAAFSTAPQPARLVIAGKFSTAGYQREIESLTRGDPRVQLVAKPIPDAEVQRYFNAADCVVLPYRAVLTSGAALLALSFGRPVIAPDLGSMKDHIDAASGVLYAADQPQALAEALRAVRSRRFDSAAIIERVSEFTWTRLASQLLEIV